MCNWFCSLSELGYLLVGIIRPGKAIVKAFSAGFQRFIQSLTSSPGGVETHDRKIDTSVRRSRSGNSTEPVKGFETTFFYLICMSSVLPWVANREPSIDCEVHDRSVLGPRLSGLKARVGHPPRWACRDGFACLRGCPRAADRRQSFGRDPSGSASDAWPTFRPWCEAYQWSVEPLPIPLAGTSRRRTRTRTVDVPDQSLPVPDGRDRNSASRELRGNERATHRRARSSWSPRRA